MSDAPQTPPPEDLRASDLREGQRQILAGLAIFVVALGLLLLAGPALAPRAAHVKGYPIAETAAPAADGTFTATLDVRDRSEWVPFDLRAGRRSDVPDLAFRRTQVSAPHGAVDLGEIDLIAAEAPDAGASWQSDEQEGGALLNPAFGKWYGYSYTTHLLAPNRHVIAVRCADGSVALVRIEGYYCDPDGSGCLTIRWRLPPARPS